MPHTGRESLHSKLHFAAAHFKGQAREVTPQVTIQQAFQFLSEVLQNVLIWGSSGFQLHRYTHKAWLEALASESLGGLQQRCSCSDTNV